MALTIRKLIDGETDRVLKRYRADAEATGGDTPVPSRAQACAEALGELLDRGSGAVSYTHLRAHETVLDIVCRILLEK